MRGRAVAAVAGLAWLAALGGATAACPCLSACDARDVPVYEAVDGVCYRLTSLPVRTWADAHAQCIADGGALAVLRAQADVDAAWTRVTRDHQYVWVGAAYNAARGAWEWVDDGGAVDPGLWGGSNGAPTPAQRGTPGGASLCAFVSRSDRGGAGALFAWDCSISMVSLCGKPEVSIAPATHRPLLSVALGTGVPAGRGFSIPVAGTHVSSSIYARLVKQPAAATGSSAGDIACGTALLEDLTPLTADSSDGTDTYTFPAASLEPDAVYILCWVGPLSVPRGYFRSVRDVFGGTRALPLSPAGVRVVVPSLPSLTAREYRVRGGAGVFYMEGANLAADTWVAIDCASPILRVTPLEGAAAGGEGGYAKVLLPPSSSTALDDGAVASGAFAGYRQNTALQLCIGIGSTSPPAADTLRPTPATIIMRRPPVFEAASLRLTHAEAIATAPAHVVRVGGSDIDQAMALRLSAHPFCEGVAGGDDAGATAGVIALRVDDVGDAMTGARRAGRFDLPAGLPTGQRLHLCYDVAAGRDEVSPGVDGDASVAGASAWRPSGVTLTLTPAPTMLRTTTTHRVSAARYATGEVVVPVLGRYLGAHGRPSMLWLFFGPCAGGAVTLPFSSEAWRGGVAVAAGDADGGGGTSTAVPLTEWSPMGAVARLRIPAGLPQVGPVDAPQIPFPTPRTERLCIGTNTRTPVGARDYTSLTDANVDVVFLPPPEYPAAPVAHAVGALIAGPYNVGLADRVYRVHAAYLPPAEEVKVGVSVGVCGAPGVAVVGVAHVAVPGVDDDRNAGVVDATGGDRYLTALGVTWRAMWDVAPRVTPSAGRGAAAVNVCIATIVNAAATSSTQWTATNHTAVLLPAPVVHTTTPARRVYVRAPSLRERPAVVVLQGSYLYASLRVGLRRVGGADGDDDDAAHPTGDVAVALRCGGSGGEGDATAGGDDTTAEAGDGNAAHPTHCEGGAEFEIPASLSEGVWSVHDMYGAAVGLEVVVVAAPVFARGPDEYVQSLSYGEWVRGSRVELHGVNIGGLWVDVVKGACPAALSPATAARLPGAPDAVSTYIAIAPRDPRLASAGRYVLCYAERLGRAAATHIHGISLIAAGPATFSVAQTLTFTHAALFRGPTNGVASRRVSGEGLNQPLLGWVCADSTCARGCAGGAAGFDLRDGVVAVETAHALRQPGGRAVVCWAYPEEAADGFRRATNITLVFPALPGFVEATPHAGLGLPRENRTHVVNGNGRAIAIAPAPPPRASDLPRITYSIAGHGFEPGLAMYWSTDPGCADPASAARVCSPYHQSVRCRDDERHGADAAVCYNPVACRCEVQRLNDVGCEEDMCVGAPCTTGYRCETTTCGGCGYRCVADDDGTADGEETYGVEETAAIDVLAAVVDVVSSNMLYMHLAASADAGARTPRPHTRYHLCYRYEAAATDTRDDDGALLRVRGAVPTSLSFTWLGGPVFTPETYEVPAAGRSLQLRGVAIAPRVAVVMTPYVDAAGDAACTPPADGTDVAAASWRYFQTAEAGDAAGDAGADVVMVAPRTYTLRTPRHDIFDPAIARRNGRYGLCYCGVAFGYEVGVGTGAEDSAAPYADEIFPDACNAGAGWRPARGVWFDLQLPPVFAAGAPLQLGIADVLPWSLASGEAEGTLQLPVGHTATPPLWVSFQRRACGDDGAHPAPTDASGDSSNTTTTSPLSIDPQPLLRYPLTAGGIRIDATIAWLLFAPLFSDTADADAYTMCWSEGGVDHGSEDAGVVWRRSGVEVIPPVLPAYLLDGVGDVDAGAGVTDPYPHRTTLAAVEAEGVWVALDALVARGARPADNRTGGSGATHLNIAFWLAPGAEGGAMDSGEGVDGPARDDGEAGFIDTLDAAAAVTAVHPACARRPNTASGGPVPQRWRGGSDAGVSLELFLAPENLQLGRHLTLCWSVDRAGWRRAPVFPVPSGGLEIMGFPVIASIAGVENASLGYSIVTVAGVDVPVLQRALRGDVRADDVAISFHEGWGCGGRQRMYFNATKSAAAHVNHTRPAETVAYLIPGVTAAARDYVMCIHYRTRILSSHAFVVTGGGDPVPTSVPAPSPAPPGGDDNATTEVPSTGGDVGNSTMSGGGGGGDDDSGSSDSPGGDDDGGPADLAPEESRSPPPPGTDVADPPDAGDASDAPVDTGGDTAAPTSPPSGAPPLACLPEHALALLINRECFEQGVVPCTTAAAGAGTNTVRACGAAYERCVAQELARYEAGCVVGGYTIDGTGRVVATTAEASVETYRGAGVRAVFGMPIDAADAYDASVFAAGTAFAAEVLPFRVEVVSVASGSVVVEYALTSVLSHADADFRTQRMVARLRSDLSGAASPYARGAGWGLVSVDATPTPPPPPTPPGSTGTGVPVTPAPGVATDAPQPASDTPFPWVNDGAPADDGLAAGYIIIFAVAGVLLFAGVVAAAVCLVRRARGGGGPAIEIEVVRTEKEKRVEAISHASAASRGEGYTKHGHSATHSTPPPPVAYGAHTQHDHGGVDKNPRVINVADADDDARDGPDRSVIVDTPLSLSFAGDGGGASAVLSPASGDLNTSMSRGIGGMAGSFVLPDAAPAAPPSVHTSASGGGFDTARSRANGDSHGQHASIFNEPAAAGGAARSDPLSSRGSGVTAASGAAASMRGLLSQGHRRHSETSLSELVGGAGSGREVPKHRPSLPPAVALTSPAREVVHVVHPLSPPQAAVHAPAAAADAPIQHRRADGGAGMGTLGAASNAHQAQVQYLLRQQQQHAAATTRSTSAPTSTAASSVSATHGLLEAAAAQLAQTRRDGRPASASVAASVSSAPTSRADAFLTPPFPQGGAVGVPAVQPGAPHPLRTPSSASVGGATRRAQGRAQAVHMLGTDAGVTMTLTAPTPDTKERGRYAGFGSGVVSRGASPASSTAAYTQRSSSSATACCGACGHPYNGGAFCAHCGQGFTVAAHAQQQQQQQRVSRPGAGLGFPTPEAP